MLLHLSGDLMNPSASVMTLLRLTELRATPLVPEVLLHLMPAACEFEEFRNQVEPIVGAGPPYWCIAWPGGQALARLILDRPELVAGLRVVDLGAGCGICAIAAAKAGAKAVVAIEPDASARAICQWNAVRNGVTIDTREGDIGAIDPTAVDIVTAGDLWYEPYLARRATSALRQFARGGILAFAGDPGRAAFPRSGIELIASYPLAASEELERAARIQVGVWRMLA